MTWCDRCGGRYDRHDQEERRWHEEGRCDAAGPPPNG